MKSRMAIAQLVLAAGLVLPTASAAPPLDLTGASFLDIDSLEKGAQGRPNEEHRVAGLKAYVQGDHARAAGYFRTAAHYADKISQHYLSLMYWHGVGVARDPVEAYVWADLAAERGTRRLLLVRERMWSELSGSDRERAMAVGEDYYARYGDEVAKPRTEGAMRRFATTKLGSRLGFDGRPMAVVGKPTAGSFGPATGSNSGSYTGSSVPTQEELYGSSRDFEAYWKMQELILVGTGTASDLLDVRTTPRP